MVRLLTLSIGLLFLLPTYTQAASLPADCGLFAVVKGKVQYKKKGKKKFKKARKNKKICQGDTVKTLKNGRARIDMADKNVLHISPDSELLIEVYSKTADSNRVLLNVIKGKVRSDVNNKYKANEKSHYRVKTKSAVAGVRGTQFLSSYNPSSNQSRFVTFEGKVAVGQLVGGNLVANVTVEPGFYTSNQGSAKPHSPERLSPKQLAQIDKESKGATPAAGGASAPAPRQPSGSDDSAKEEPKQETQPEAKPEAKQDPKPKADPPKNPNKGGNNAGNNPVGGRDIASVDPGLGVDTGIDMDMELPDPGEMPMIPDTMQEPVAPPTIRPIDFNPNPTQVNPTIETAVQGTGKVNVRIELIPPGAVGGTN